MDDYASFQYVELFHLLFLDQMGRKIAKQQYALKGGCNLRFFLKSIRYSQDMDLDIYILRKETLSNNVNRILESAPFRLILHLKNMEIGNISESKQTETTQRWKIQLKLLSTSLLMHTKIEFSRRGSEDPSLFESVDPAIIRTYQLTPIYANHYTREAALKQKIWALIKRTQTQARDLFDLFHLLSMGVKADRVPLQVHALLSQAQENAMSIDYDAFKSQVLAYLPFEYQDQYRDPSLWDAMVLQVCNYLSELLCD